MGRGLSKLQRRVLGALESFPRTARDVTPAATALPSWARPADVLTALGQDPPTNAQRVALSKSLLRLCNRGLISGFQDDNAVWRYALAAVPPPADSVPTTANGPLKKTSA